MSDTIDIFGGVLPGPRRPRLPLSWSDGQIGHITAMADGVGCRSPLDGDIAKAILHCLDGDFDRADAFLFPIVYEHLSLIDTDSESFISVLFGFFVLQQFEFVAGMLRRRFGFQPSLEIAIDGSKLGDGCLKWEVSRSGHHRFSFDEGVFRYDKTRNDLLGLYWSFPLYTQYANLSEAETGDIIINQMDIGRTPGLAWCDNRPDYFLVPDCIFIPTMGYAYAREILAKKSLPWAERKDVAFWRGGTTGIPKNHNDWRTLERVQLCELARRHSHLECLDIGLSSIVQVADPLAVQSIRESGLLSGFVPWEDWGQFKYQIDIDGNSSPWSNLFQRLLTGNPVLKVESSRGLCQWYYQDLKPWSNYIPVASDMSDLIDKLQWLRRNDSFAEAVGAAGRNLALDLTYEAELNRGVQTISRAFRYFRGGGALVGPYGRRAEIA